MRRIIRHIVSALLASILCFTAVMPAFAGEEKPFTVLMLGDSTNIGYATKAFRTEVIVKD